MAAWSLIEMKNSQTSGTPFYALQPPARHGDELPHHATLRCAFRAETRSTH
jgi:hypothetical protein